MSDDDIADDEASTLTFRMPMALRSRIKSGAGEEERTESQFLRFHLTRLLDERDAKASAGKPAKKSAKRKAAR